MNREPESSSGKKRQPTPVFLPGKSHEQRSLAAIVHGAVKQSDVTQQPNNNIRALQDLGHPLTKVYVLTLTSLIKGNLDGEEFPSCASISLPTPAGSCSMSDVDRVHSAPWSVGWTASQWFWPFSPLTGWCPFHVFVPCASHCLQVCMPTGQLDSHWKTETPGQLN